MSFAGLSAFELSHLGAGAGIPFPFDCSLAALIAVPLGVLIGLPALRLRGVNLAVVTLAAAFAIDALLFNDESFSGGLRGATSRRRRSSGSTSGSRRATPTRA